jgi:hypothetical protein
MLQDLMAILLTFWVIALELCQKEPKILRLKQFIVSLYANQTERSKQ